MAGPFARLRRGESAEPSPDAPTQSHEPVSEGAEAAPATDQTAVLPALAAEASAEAQAPLDASPNGANPPADTIPGEETPGFIERGKLRRRLRFVRRARELALRDLGGLVFDLHRFGRERGDLVEQKLAALTTLDSEMRALETLLAEPREVTVLHEPGLASCPRCGALHASDAGFCSACGLPVGAGADLPTGPALAGPLAALPAPDPQKPVAVQAPSAKPGTVPDPESVVERPTEPEIIPEPKRPATGERPTASS